jgi:hypothetical protein
MEKAGDLSTCPGCGAKLPRRDLRTDERANASAECWGKYCELIAYTLSLRDPAFPHQLAVDAYAAQHTGKNSKPIGISFALIGLCLVREYGYTGRQAQKAHIFLAGRSRSWKKFSPPPCFSWPMTAADVLKAPPGPARLRMINKWASSVWDGWSKEHAGVRQLIRMHFNPEKTKFL